VPISDKPQPWFALPDHAVLALQGRDALAFAHAQFMNDARPLEDGQWQWSGWLTPKGRVVALFALLRRGPEELWLVLPDVDAEGLATALQRFVFRSKVVISPRPDLQVSGSFGGSAPGALIDMGERSLRIGDPAPADAGAVARWKASDLAHGIPRLPDAQAGQWTPQQLSLERLQAFSVKKGCYPGQEIVARTHFLGQAKRGLVLLEADAPLAEGTEVRIGERVAGTIVSAAGSLALAVMPLEREPDGALTVDGAEVRERPLQDM
jgi:folate-binding protein YgfZ